MLTKEEIRQVVTEFFSWHEDLKNLLGKGADVVANANAPAHTSNWPLMELINKEKRLIYAKHKLTDEQRLLHFVKAIDFIGAHTSISETLFYDSEVLKRAIVREIEVIGEASNHLSPTLKAAYLRDTSPHYSRVFRRKLPGGVKYCKR